MPDGIVIRRRPSRARTLPPLNKFCIDNVSNGGGYVEIDLLNEVMAMEVVGWLTYANSTHSAPEDDTSLLQFKQPPCSRIGADLHQRGRSMVSDALPLMVGRAKHAVAAWGDLGELSLRLASAAPNLFSSSHPSLSHAQRKQGGSSHQRTRTQPWTRCGVDRRRAHTRTVDGVGQHCLLPKAWQLALAQKLVAARCLHDAVRGGSQRPRAWKDRAKVAAWQTDRMGLPTRGPRTRRKHSASDIFRCQQGRMDLPAGANSCAHMYPFC